MSTLYDRIRQCRIRNGLTQDQLATMLGYTDRSTIAKIEKGIIDLPQSKIVAFADALGVTTLYLLNGEGEKSDAFRQAVRDELDQSDGLKDAIDEGSFDINFVDRVLDKSGPITLDDACQVADEMGMTVSDLLGETDNQRSISQALADEKVNKIISLFLALPDHKKQEAIRYIRYLAESKDT